MLVDLELAACEKFRSVNDLCFIISHHLISWCKMNRCPTIKMFVSSPLQPTLKVSSMFSNTRILNYFHSTFRVRNSCQGDDWHISFHVLEYSHHKLSFLVHHYVSSDFCSASAPQVESGMNFSFRPRQWRLVFREGVVLVNGDAVAYPSDGRGTGAGQPAPSHAGEANGDT